jgi:hypothetical protein
MHGGTLARRIGDAHLGPRARHRILRRKSVGGWQWGPRGERSEPLGGPAARSASEDGAVGAPDRAGATQLFESRAILNPSSNRSLRD